MLDSPTGRQVVFYVNSDKALSQPFDGKASIIDTAIVSTLDSLVRFRDTGNEEETGNAATAKER